MAEPQTDRTRYEAHPAEVKNVRRRTEQVLRDWDVSEEALDAAILIASELTANAVQHIGPVKGREFGLTLRLLETVVRIEVRDAGPVPTTCSPAREDLWADSGRGLLLVDRLATSWGSQPEVLGKTVWAHVPLAAGRHQAQAEGAS
jgi:anti-sigma regulatory factor (Ser/Thr protein kinase)